MKKLAQILFALLLVVGINNAFAATEDRHITGFNAISVSGSFDVYITQGSTESVKVEAPDNVISHIITEVVGGELKVYNKDDRGWNGWFGSNHRKMVIYIAAKDLNSVALGGSGDMYFKNGIRANDLKVRVSGSGSITGMVDCKELEAGVSGSGDMKLNGHALTSNVRVSGSGGYAAHDLSTNKTAVHVLGSGNASVNVNESLEASVSGSGDIRYTGAVKNVNSSKSGSGSISRG